MSGRQCYHCKQWIAAGEPHDCWTTTEHALTADLSDDLREAWERLREAAIEFGEQRVYASHHSIMFSRTSCYFFVRPRRKYLEVCIFLGRPLRGPLVHRSTPAAKTKFANLLRIVHRDQIEAPLTDWLRDAYEEPERRRGLPAGARQPRVSKPVVAKAAGRTAEPRKSGRGAPSASALRPRRASITKRPPRKKR